jgi:hypothetical protein
MDYVNRNSISLCDSQVGLGPDSDGAVPGGGANGRPVWRDLHIKKGLLTFSNLLEFFLQKKTSSEKCCNNIS